MSSKSAAEPGQWRTSRAPYLRGIMDAVCDPRVQEVCWKKPTQVGATECLTNIAGFYMHQDPSPILVVQPTLGLARTWSMDRLDPMLEESPELAQLLPRTGRREKGKTILHKDFGGSQIDIIGAKAASALASRPKRILLADEIDRYPMSAGKEGDPLTLARRRLSNFWNRKIFAVSSPTFKGVSAIDDLFDASDQRHYFMPCPHCEKRITFRWEQLRWESGQPETAHYVCEHCGGVIEEREKPKMLAAGEWVATVPAPPGRRKPVGFYLNALFSPWTRWYEIVAEWIKAQGRPEKLKVFVNTFLAESWEEKGVGANASALKARREPYPAEAPAGVGLITAAVDVQGDRLEIDVYGWGEEEESWHLRHEIIWGDPAKRATWDRCALVLTRRWKHESGVEMRTSAAAVDTGGHHTDAAYSFCRRRLGLHLWAVKGLGGHGIVPVRAPLRKSKAKAPLVILGSDALKDMLFARLATEITGPGYIHFNHDAPDEWIDQFGAEQAMQLYERGKTVRKYVKTDGQRNEAIDLYCYALAALLMFGPTVRETLGRRAEALRAKGAELQAKASATGDQAPTDEAAPKKRRPRRRSKFVHDY